MNPRRDTVVRGRRRYSLCRAPGRAKRPLPPAALERRSQLWLPVATFVVIVLVGALVHGRLTATPGDPRAGLPVASLAHYSFDDFANAQR